MRSFLFSGRNQNTAERVALQGRKERKVLMRKALLIVALLLLVTPVMATTTITAVQEGQFTASDGNKVQTVRIDYSSNVDVRAFALDINIDSNNGSPNFQGIRNFKVGESNGAMAGGSSGYGIFPSRFRQFIVVTGPNWVDPNYNPTTAYNEPGTTSHTWGMGYPQMIVEMGTLYAGDPNKPAQSGTLFRFDVNAWGATGTFKLTIAADAMRGGVVGNDGNAIAANFVGTSIYFAPVGCTVPNVVNQPEATATGNIVNAGFTLGTRTTAHSDTIAAGNVISTNPAAGVAPCGSAVAYVVSLGPCVVPNVVNEAEAAATADIVNAGFCLGTRTTACSNTIAAGNVISTTPAANATPGCGTCVAYVVSTGPCPCTVPCIIGLTKAQAEAAITAAGFTIGTETGVSSDATPVNQVTAQSPTCNTQQTCGSAVTLSYVCHRVTCATCLGDVTGDNKIKVNDLTALTILLNTAGSPYSVVPASCLYNPCADLTGDSKIKVNDLTALTIKLNGYGSPYNHTCP